jgi:hypothetical protein
MLQCPEIESKVPSALPLSQVQRSLAGTSFAGIDIA